MHSVWEVEEKWPLFTRCLRLYLEPEATEKQAIAAAEKQYEHDDVGGDWMRGNVKITVKKAGVYL